MELFDLHFDRHAVAVPAGHVRSLIPFEGFLLDDHVFQDLVDGMADMNGTVGIRRTVMKNELLGVATLIKNAVDDLFLVPFTHPAGFAFGEIPAHRERCIRKV